MFFRARPCLLASNNRLSGEDNDQFPLTSWTPIRILYSLSIHQSGPGLASRCESEEPECSCAGASADTSCRVSRPAIHIQHSCQSNFLEP